MRGPACRRPRGDQVMEVVAGIDHADLVVCRPSSPWIMKPERCIVEASGVPLPGLGPAGREGETDERRLSAGTGQRRVRARPPGEARARSPRIVVKAAGPGIGAVNDRIDGTHPLGLASSASIVANWSGKPEPVVERGVDRVEVGAAVRVDRLVTRTLIACGCSEKVPRPARKRARRSAARVRRRPDRGSLGLLDARRSEPISRAWRS